MSVLVVGAGFTSSVLCKTLRATAPLLNVTVWEKSRGAGGRSATKRDGEHSCDIGTQYLTHWKSDVFFDPYIALLKSVEVITEFTGKIVDPPGKYSDGECTHYVAPKGMNSLSKYFLTGTNPHYSTKVVSLTVRDDEKIVVHNEDNRSAEFDIVVLTIPAPQLLQLDMRPSIPDEVREKIKAIEFTPRFSLMVVFDSVPEMEWVMKYHDDDVVRFTVWDHVKRCRGLNPTLLVHSSARYAVSNTDVKTKEEAGVEMLFRLRQLLPELPDPIKTIPHYWRFGQVYKPYEGTPGFLVLNEKPLIVAGGDSFMATSNLSHAAKSGEMLAGLVRDNLGIPQFKFKDTLKNK